MRFISIVLSMILLFSAATLSLPAIAGTVGIINTADGLNGKSALLGKKGASNPRTVTIDVDNVLCSNFYGEGSNLWLGQKYTDNMSDAYYEVNYKRIQTMRPAYVRMMVMPWMIMDLSQDMATIKENYYSGKYYDSDDFKFFREYCKAFKDAGTTVIFNLGSGGSNKDFTWLGIQDVGVYQDAETIRYVPQLDNLEAYAKTCAYILKTCWDEGLTNVSMLAFNNEVNGTCAMTFGDKRVYWIEMLRLVDEELKKTVLNDGSCLRDKITVFGTELSYNSAEMIENVADYWCNYMDKYAADYFDLHSVHFYQTNTALNNSDAVGMSFYRYLNELTKGFVDKLNNKGNILANEYMFPGKKNINSDDEAEWIFGATLASTYAAYANHGIGGTASWYLHGQALDKRGYGYTLSGLAKTNWTMPSPGKDPDYAAHGGKKEETVSRMSMVSDFYFDESLMMRYTPKNGKSVKSTIAGNYDAAVNDNGDLISTAFVSEDGKDATIFIITDGTATNFNIEFNGLNTNKSFKKFVHVYSENIKTPNDDGNALIPNASGDFSLSDGKFSDNEIPRKHSLIVYTTYDEPVQVKLSTLEFEVSKNSNLEIDPSIASVSGTANTAVKWGVRSGTEGRNGSISYDEAKKKYVYVPSSDAKSGDTIALIIESESDDINRDSAAYGVAVITIK